MIDEQIVPGARGGCEDFGRTIVVSALVQLSRSVDHQAYAASDAINVGPLRSAMDDGMRP